MQTLYYIVCSMMFYQRVQHRGFNGFLFCFVFCFDKNCFIAFHSLSFIFYLFDFLFTREVSCCVTCQTILHQSVSKPEWEYLTHHPLFTWIFCIFHFNNIYTPTTRTTTGNQIIACERNGKSYTIFFFCHAITCTIGS